MGDIGGQHMIRPLWRHYYHGTEAVIFVVDSNDRERIAPNDVCNDDNARDELHNILEDDLLADAALLVFANKQDLPNAMSVNEISDKLQLNKLRNRQVPLQEMDYMRDSIGYPLHFDVNAKSESVLK